MLIKICGFKSPSQAVAAAEAGADMIGLNFYPPSPRSIAEDQAAEIAQALPPHIMKVGLFVNVPVEEIRVTAYACGLNAVQLHGDYGRQQIAELAPLKVIRAFRIKSEDDLAQLGGVRADYVLLDAAVEGMHGGTGQTFDWRLAAAARDYTNSTILLAGGLSPVNIAEAIQQAQPDGVDVASGVETSPGEKDIELIRQFIARAR